MLHLSRDAQ